MLDSRALFGLLKECKGLTELLQAFDFGNISGNARLRYAKPGLLQIYTRTRRFGLALFTTVQRIQLKT